MQAPITPACLGISPAVEDPIGEVDVSEEAAGASAEAQRSETDDSTKPQCDRAPLADLKSGCMRLMTYTSYLLLVKANPLVGG